MDYGMIREVNLSYEEAIARVTETLKEQGFGVLTEIDVKATFKKKLDVDWPQFKILGACSPGFAHEVLSLNPQLSLMLPCNVVVRVAEGKTLVSAIDPMMMVANENHPRLHEIATEVKGKLDAALEAL